MKKWVFNHVVPQYEKEFSGSVNPAERMVSPMILVFYEYLTPKRKSIIGSRITAN